MELHNLSLLATLMKSHNVSQRGLAQIAGYGSHAYMGRLLRGEVKTLAPTPAARIAHYFNVDLDDLFVSRASTDAARSVRPRRKSRVA